ncbi:MAG: Eco57I restriction-modification methylase domain-containing protein [Polaromonas sp.]
MTKPAFNQDHIKRFQFKQLFNELGWDLPTQQQPFSVAVGIDTWLLDVVAVKKGVQVLHCRPDAKGNPPDYASRQKIERKVTPEVREHLIVFTDAAQTTQVWQWVSRLQGKTAQYREVVFRKGETPELLTQKLSRLHFTLDEEELLTVLGVTQRMDDAAPREKVTKKFYGDFEKQRKAFAEFINGIPATSEDQRWYTAVLIDRLMFLWFLQEKGFLDGKKDYLQSRLTAHLAAPADATFYKSFLAPLFFRGFAEERTAANRASIEAAFGNVPYLNGGLFAEHQLEQKYRGALDVADAAFIKLFAFFDEWEWHLDERPLKTGKDGGKEINPDVLGYIFEKFVNQKQMGAYYTKEDITDYIGKNTIIPCLLAKVRAEHPKAFDDLVWPLLQQSGDAYIYPAMLKGVDAAYPPDITDGLDTEAPDLLARRKPWNKRADDAVSLPTEIWRETIARHQRTREVRAKITAGELKDVGDLITYNLDIRQFAQDLIERCTDVALLKSFWFALAGRLPRKSNEKFRHGLSVLDPTCGSGAFLFAALNILKPLYDATLHTLQAVRSDALIAGEASHPEKWAEVDEILKRFAASASGRHQDYAVIKHIIVNNLYGVDIEEQATEIAKLRLFLKLVALLEPGDDIEPLPDIDFNIRHGNTLVGYATADETEKAVKGAKQVNMFSDAWEDIRIRLTAVEQQYNHFQIQQVQRGGHVAPSDKQALVDTLAELEEMLNYHLAREYGVNTTKTADYEKWKLSHQPFHWYVDFYPLMASGGFDAIIGNPPYIAASKVRSNYDVKNYETKEASDIYAWCLERAGHILSKYGATGMIVPLSLSFSRDFSALRQYLYQSYHLNYFSSYAKRPSMLFDGVQIRCTVHIGLRQTTSRSPAASYTTRIHRWYAGSRDTLFSCLRYANYTALAWPSFIPKAGAENLLNSLGTRQDLQTLGSMVSSQITQHKLLYKKSGYNWLTFCKDIPPCFDVDGESITQNEFGEIYFRDAEALNLAYLLLNGKFQYLYWSIVGDDFHLASWMFKSFPINFSTISAEDKEALHSLAQNLDLEIFSTLSFMTMHGKKLGNFNLSKVRHLTDVSDTLFSTYLGGIQIWSELELLYAQTFKTGAGGALND